MLHAFPSIILLISDSFYGDIFFFKARNWRSSFWCWTVFCFYLYLTFSSFINLCFLSFSRLIVVKSPLDTRCKHLSHVVNLSLIIPISVITVSFFFTLLTWALETFFFETSPLMILCTPFVDPNDKMIMVKILCFLYLFGALSALSFILCAYTQLFFTFYMKETIKCASSVSDCVH